MALTDQEIIDILKDKNTKLENHKQALEAQIRQKKMDLFRSRSADRARLATEIGLLQKKIDSINFDIDTYNQRIQNLEQKIANNAAPKIEEQKPIPKQEASTAYEPKKEPNLNNKNTEIKPTYLGLNEYSKNQGYEFDIYPTQDLIKDAEKDFAIREDKAKYKEKAQYRMEFDILKSIAADLADVTNYVNIIDETYSSKSASVVSVLENLKRKQGTRNPVFDKKPPKNTLDIYGGPKYNSNKNVQPNRSDSFEELKNNLKDYSLDPQIKLIRQTDQIDQSAPQVKIIHIAYETSSGPNKRKIPVLKIEEA